MLADVQYMVASEYAVCCMQWLPAWVQPHCQTVQHQECITVPDARTSMPRMSI